MSDPPLISSTVYEYSVVVVGSGLKDVLETKYTVKKVTDFPSPGGMSLTKLSLAEE